LEDNVDPRILSFRAALDKQGLTSFQFRMIVVAIVLSVMDGFDVQIVGYIAPILSDLWHIDHKSFGLVFAAGLVGLALGTLTFSPMADKFGCRPVLIGCTMLYALGTLATTKADSWTMLLELRFVTGLGLGGVLPCTIAVVSDFAPTRVRNLMIALCASGFAIGGSLGGFVAAATIERFGWQSVFLIGGIVPLGLLPILLIWFPESLPRLLADPRLHSRLEKTVVRIVPGWTVPEAAGPELQVIKERFPVATLFGKGLAVPTLIIWTIFFCNLLLLYFFVNWIPTVVHGLGQPLEASNRAAAVFQLAGILGGVCLTAFTDRSGRPEWTLAVAFVGIAVCCLLFGLVAGSSLYIIVASAAVTGFCVVGGLAACISFAGTYYPAKIRATGIGWAMGIGRLGSILGPVAGGMLLMLHLTPQVLFSIFSIPALLAAICCFFIKSSPEQTKANDEDHAHGPDIARPVINELSR
jgi:MFS transporter, AAHS family, 4-hydroxybenzoate transporter